MKWYFWLIIIVVILIIIYSIYRYKTNGKRCFESECFKNCISNKDGYIDNVPLPEMAFQICEKKCNCDVKKVK